MAWALITNTFAQSTNAINVTSAGINTTGANLIVLILHGYDLGDVGTLTDSNANVWVATATQNGNGARIKLYYCINPTVGAGHTFTITTPGISGLYPAITVSAWSNASAPLLFDQEVNNTAAGATSIQTGPLSPTLTNELIITGITTTTGGVTAAIDSGFTITNQSAHTANAMGVAHAYLIETVAVTAFPTWSWTPGMGVTGGIIAFSDSTGTPAGAVVIKSAELPVEVMLGVSSTVKSAQLVVEVLRSMHCEVAPIVGPHSGIYKITPGKRQDTLWTTFPSTEDVKIPDPLARTALVGG